MLATQAEGADIGYLDNQLQGQSLSGRQTYTRCGTDLGVGRDRGTPTRHRQDDLGGSGHMDLTGAIWHKSTRSSGNHGNCVEVADNLPGVVGVRDSKDQAGPVLTFTPAAWRSFLGHAKRP